VDALQPFPIGWHAEAKARHAEAAELSWWQWPTVREDWIGHVRRIWKIFSDGLCYLELTEDSEAWSLEYLNLDLDAGKDDDRNLDILEIKIFFILLIRFN
jgi:hypothetical protein